MPTLSPAQRKKLESTVIAARRLAETGAANALKALAVAHHEPYPHMDPEDRALRNLLRSKGRLLGDKLQDNGKQEIQHLSYELAYEYWHKMLFARFLEANQLLIHPGYGTAVTLEECEELAPEEGYGDKWEAAAAYASRMLPAIFRPDDPLLQLRFATEDRLALEKLLDELETAIFQADDSLGWTYQFWQSEAKDAINKSGDKIDGARLPAVTQLFTEPYMVHFLIDNTLGAWWASRHPKEEAPVDFAYLRRKEDGSPAAGSYEGWPKTTAEVTVLDPCMGSGHFIASLFPILAALRMKEEGLSKAEATEKVISQNLHGLELDARCTQIAAFNLALTAWKFNGNYLELPEMNLACSGIAPQGNPQDWARLAGEDHNLSNGMSMLFQLFRKAPELGSLIDPTTVLNDHLAPRPEKLIPVLEKAIQLEKNAEDKQRGVMALGIATAAKLLSQKYVLQITNVPYRTRISQAQFIRNFCLDNYPASKADLATVFIERLQNTMEKGGAISCVTPQNWLFLSSYMRFRQTVLKEKSIDFIANLGPGAFREITGEVVKVILVSFHNYKPSSSHSFMGLDVSDRISVSEKEHALKVSEHNTQSQIEQLSNPDSRVMLEKASEGIFLSSLATCIEGLSTGDLPRFVIKFWEIKSQLGVWQPFIQNVHETQQYAARTDLILWENGNGSLRSSPSAHNFPAQEMNGFQVLGNTGIRITQMGNFPCTIYRGEIFGKNGGTLIAKDSKFLPAIWEFCTSKSYVEEVKKIDKSMAVTVGSFVKVPFDLPHWQKVAAEKYPNGLPEPYSDDPTQWLFHGHPLHGESALQVALARFLGYRWPAEHDAEMKLAQDARDKIAAIRAFDHLSDEDGIVCIPAVNGEAPAADRLRDYLSTIWGTEWSHQRLDQLLQAAGAKNNDLELWLRDQFFQDHTKLFKNRPFIWQIWDGRKDGFSALVNYHMLDKKALQTLIYTYLGDWLRQCESKVKQGESGAEGLLQAATALKAKLELILEGEAPYDIFVRWKPLAEQPLGWDPDLNDGVRLNIRPFVEAEVLRKKIPSLKWGVDRGKNPPGSPWGEVRDNGVHLGLGEKRGARGK